MITADFGLNDCILCNRFLNDGVYFLFEHSEIMRTARSRRFSISRANTSGARQQRSLRPPPLSPPTRSQRLSTAGISQLHDLSAARLTTGSSGHRYAPHLNVGGRLNATHLQRTTPKSSTHIPNITGACSSAASWLPSTHPTPSTSFASIDSYLSSTEHHHHPGDDR